MVMATILTTFISIRILTREMSKTSSISTAQFTVMLLRAKTLVKIVTARMVILIIQEPRQEMLKETTTILNPMHFKNFQMTSL